MTSIRKFIIAFLLTISLIVVLPIGRVDAADDLLEVPGMRAEQDRAAEPRRFQRILPAMRHQRPADEGERRQAVEQAELADRIGDVGPAPADRLLEFTNDGPVAKDVPFAGRLDLIEAYYDLGRAQWFAGDPDGAKETWAAGYQANKFNPWGKKCREVLTTVQQGGQPPKSGDGA